jgi:hypothetical protein
MMAFSSQPAGTVGFSVCHLACMIVSSVIWLKRLFLVSSVWYVGNDLVKWHHSTVLPASPPIGEICSIYPASDYCGNKPLKPILRKK